MSLTDLAECAALQLPLFLLSYDRMAYPNRYELFKRVEESPGKEKYVILSFFEDKPASVKINDAFHGKPR